MSDTENLLDIFAFENAILSLERSLNVVRRRRAVAEADEWETLRAGVIQNFEFTFELSWKMMKRWLDLNISPDLTFGVTKKDLYRLAAENGLITDVERWFDFQQSRNKTSHVYAEDIAEDVFEKATEFLPYAKNLFARLEKKV
ncbi:MAG: nucleotidyltransferase substrate binding protein [Thermoguttaceae bacterium]